MTRGDLRLGGIDLLGQHITLGLHELVGTGAWHGFQLVVEAGDSGYQQFERLLNSSDAASWAELSKLPGFVGVQSAVASSTSRREALERMEQLRTDSLPVINAEGFFMGTVERSKLTASLILAVTQRLDGSGQ